MAEHELAKHLVSRLCRDKLKIAAAESCTGGGVAKEITEISGSSNVFDCGIIAYANCVKANILKVSWNSLDKYGAVSEQVAVEMAKGVKELAGADIGISTTGIAGPTGGTEEKPVGRVHIAAVTDKKVFHRELSLFDECMGNRALIREATIKYVLELALFALNADE